ncbi:thioesterase [Cytophagales bacterium WSM2-2]|nr:thioesterase [Cytophagales bacterium WSM2-2]
MKKIYDSFAKQGLMKLLQANLKSVEDGLVVIECERNEGMTQQNGYFHAGVMTSIADSACGYAAHTKMKEGKDVLSVEFKINFLKPADTDKIIAIGKVLQSGKTLTVCEGSVYDAKHEVLLARMTATMISVDSR